MVKPKFDIEATEKAISKLIERIKKAFYNHQPTFSDDSLRHSKATERKKPHDSSRCEACHKHYEKKLTKNIKPTNILQIYISIW